MGNSEKNCRTCTYAVLTLVNECSKTDDKGRYIHRGGMCPGEFMCPFWEQADEFTQKTNSIDWSQAGIVVLD